MDEHCIWSAGSDLVNVVYANEEVDLDTHGHTDAIYTELVDVVYANADPQVQTDDTYSGVALNTVHRDMVCDGDGVVNQAIHTDYGGVVIEPILNDVIEPILDDVIEPILDVKSRTDNGADDTPPHVLGEVINGQMESSDNEDGAVNVALKRTKGDTRKSRIEQRDARVAGRSYKNRAGIVKDSLLPTQINCSCRLCEHAGFNNEDALRIFTEFRALNRARQDDFIITHTSSTDTKRRKVDAVKPREKQLTYNLNDKHGDKKRVCLSYFINTLAISYSRVKHIKNHRSSVQTYGGVYRRGKHSPHNKISAKVLRLIDKHINKYPVVESHYCRQSSNRKYLPAGLTLAIMYDEYKRFVQGMVDNSLKVPVSMTTFRDRFRKKFSNYSVHVPKKDRCVICYGIEYHETLDAKTQYQRDVIDPHRELVKAARKEKDNDKKRAMEDPVFKTVTCDLQKVLILPAGRTVPAFYARKAAVYNFTTYDQTEPHDAHCYVWPEWEGQRGSNEIGSHLMDYLQGLPPNIKHVSFFSDNCGGQNKNKFISACLLYAVSQHKSVDVIEQKYLVSHHTQMEVDSMHSTIERRAKNQELFTTNCWLNVIRSCRPTHPYTIHSAQHGHFYDLHKLAEDVMVNTRKNTNNERVEWNRVVNFKYVKEQPASVFYRYKFDNVFMELNVSSAPRQRSRSGKSVASATLEPAYASQLPISAQKKDDLIRLCSGPSPAISPDFHAFYHALPTANCVRDCLNEPNYDEPSDTE